MPVHLQLTTHDHICRVVSADAPDQPLAATPLGDLPAVDALYKDPYSLGTALFEALGGAALLGLLETCDTDMLLLECDDLAGAIAWEYAVTDEQRFLACDYGLLRLEPRDPRPTDARTPPRLLVLCADPLRYQNNELPADQLQFDDELAALSAGLAKGTRALAARRLPPTADRLIDALADGPALLHFSCHGKIVAVNGQPDVALSLEDAHGIARPLLGRDLRRSVPRGSIRMVLLSACQSATLAQAFVRDGVPVALGMQHTFPDPQSAALAATLYRWLAAGHNVAEAVRQARRAVTAENPRAVGLLVAYTCRDAWGALPLPNGQPDVDMRVPMRCSLPESVSVPATGLLGRNNELIEVAQALDAHPIVTITGTGGMGKTSLAAAFIQRFGWRFGRVLGVTFASASVDVRRVCEELLERAGLGGDVQAILKGEGERAELVQMMSSRLHEREIQRAQYGSSTDPAITIDIKDIQAKLAALQGDNLQAQALVQLRERLLDAVRLGDLLLFDNYESVLTPDPGDEVEAQAIARLVALLQARGAKLLLTSRDWPAGLPNEIIIPSGGLDGLSTDAAAKLFLDNSSRAKKHTKEQQQNLAQDIAQATGGHPLAIMLLASAYDHSSGPPEHFLDQWPTMLAHAERQALGPRHAQFATAIEFSLKMLKPEQQRLFALVQLDIPFLPEAAVFSWELELDDGNEPTKAAIDKACRILKLFTERSLLQSDTEDKNNDPISYRFQPALRQELVRRAEDAKIMPDVTPYTVWLARLANDKKIKPSDWLWNVVSLSMPFIETASEKLQGKEYGDHIENVRWLREQFGFPRVPADVPPEDLLLKIEKGKVVPFIGARLSMSELPGTPDLGKLQRELLGTLSFDEEERAQIEQWIDKRAYSEVVMKIAKKDVSKLYGELRFILNPHVDRSSLDSPAHEYLDALDFRCYITINQDRLLERLLKSDYQVVTSSDTAMLRQLREEPDSRFILKLYGDIASPATILSSDAILEEIRNNNESKLSEEAKVLNDFLENIFRRNTVLFLGTALTDHKGFKELIILLAKRWGTPSQRHFALVERNPEREEDRSDVGSKLNIEMLRYEPDPEHSQIWEFISFLNTAEKREHQAGEKWSQYYFEKDRSEKYLPQQLRLEETARSVWFLTPDLSNAIATDKFLKGPVRDGKLKNTSEEKRNEAAHIFDTKTFPEMKKRCDNLARLLKEEGLEVRALFLQAEFDKIFDITDDQKKLSIIADRYSKVLKLTKNTDLEIRLIPKLTASDLKRKTTSYALIFGDKPEFRVDIAMAQASQATGNFLELHTVQINTDDVYTSVIEFERHWASALSEKASMEHIKEQFKKAGFDIEKEEEQ